MILPVFLLCIRLAGSPDCAPSYTKFPSINFYRQNFPLYGFNNLKYNLLGEDAAKRPYLPFSITVTAPKELSYYGIDSDPPIQKVSDRSFVYSSTNGRYSNHLRVSPGPPNMTPVIYLILTLLLIKFWRHSFYFLPLLVVAFHGTFLPYQLLLAPYLIFAKKTKFIYLIFVIFAVTSATRLGCYSCHEILQPGSDQLTYESFARDILAGSFWNAGEPRAVFYYTPLYRYFIALFHFVGGESMWPVRFFGFLIYQFTWLVLVRLIVRLFSKSTALLSLWILAIFDKLPQLGFLFLFKEYYSESLGLSFLIFALYFLFIKKPWISGLFLGLSIAIRPNYFPAVLMFINIRLLIIFILPVLLVMVRNFLITGHWQFFNSSGASTLAPGLVEKLYHGQKETNISNLYFQILSRPFQILAPLWNNFRVMLGVPDFNYLASRSLPAGVNIPLHSWVYFPIWIFGTIRIAMSKLSREQIIWLSIPLLIFITNLPFGVYFNGSAKYFPYVLFLLPFAIEFVSGTIRRSH